MRRDDELNMHERVMTPRGFVVWMFDTAVWAVILAAVWGWISVVQS